MAIRILSDQNVTSNVIAIQAFRLGTDSLWKIRGNAASTELAFEYSTSSALSDANIKVVFNSSGAVGIGVTGPVAPLDVFGAAVQNGSTPGIKLSSSNTQQTVFAIGNTGTRQYELAVGGTTSSIPGAFYIYDNNAADFRITLATSGNVGIGTTSPDSKLHVDSGVSSTSDWGNLGIISDFPINNAGRIYTSYLLQDSESIKGAGIGLAYDGTGYKMHFGTASTTSSGLSTQMTIDRLGNVGIGDTSPQGKLEVNNRNTATGAALFIKGGEDDLSPIAGQYTGLAFGYGGGDIYNNGAILWEFTNTAANGKLHFAVNPTAGDGTANLSDSKMTILDSGNVGIGTTSPDYKLEVESTSDADLVSIKSTAIANNTQMRLGISGNDSVISGTGGSSGSLVFKTYGSERLRINSTGSIYPPIGIATGTTYYGYDAGLNVGSNSHNTYYGYYAGRANTGTRNTFIGSQTAYAVTNNVNYSVIIGYNALKTATNSAESNVIIGDSAASNSSGFSNCVVIGQAAANSLTGNDNTVVGYGAYYGVTNGTSGVIIGYQAGNAANAIGHVMIGWRAGYVNQGNQNVYIGQEAGRNNTSGASNVFIGVDAGYANVTGNSNTFVGTQAGTYQTGLYNTAIGHVALFGTSGTSNASYNTALGYKAGNSITSGAENTLLGRGAGAALTTGTSNVAIGSLALHNDNGSNHNIAIGRASMQTASGGNNVGVGTDTLEVASGSNNTAVGYRAGTSTSTGGSNVFLGTQAGYNNTTGSVNTYIGYLAGYGQTGGAGEGNTAVGYYSQKDKAATGNNNTSLGFYALGSDQNAGFSGTGNTAGGYYSQRFTSSGSYNTTFGYIAGERLTSGTNNTLIGAEAGTSSAPSGQLTSESNRVCLGNNAVSHLYCKISTITTSDKRDKTNFGDIAYGLGFVNQLKPTAFEFKKDGKRDTKETDGVKRYGFIAQEILELEGDNPVIINNDDKENLKYQESHLIPVLVKAIQELKAEIELLKNK